MKRRMYIMPLEFTLLHILISLLYYYGNRANVRGGATLFVKFGMEIEHKYTYKLCMKYCLPFKNYKYGDGANPSSHMWQIWRSRNLC